MATTEPVDRSCADDVCEHLPVLERMNYCYGQMLGAQDFIAEQQYFLNKIHLLSRCLHGYGVVCGLTVNLKEGNGKQHATVAEQEGDEQPTPQWPLFLGVTCGMAIDSAGRELVVRQPIRGNLFEFADAEVCQHLLNNARSPSAGFAVYVTLEYHKRQTHPQDLPSTGECAQLGDRQIYTRWCEHPRVRLTFEPPPPQTCDPCCDPVEERRVWLAKIDFMATGESTSPEVVRVDNTFRRPITTYLPTRIAAVNWIHTGVYEECLAEDLLQGGLIITFTAPIDEQSIKNHEVRFTDAPDDKREILTNDIVEVCLCDEHRVAHASPQMLQSEIEILSDTQIKIKVRPTRLTPPQRVLFTFRSDFVLDTCCRPVDGSHLGGFVPFLPHWKHDDDKPFTHPTHPDHLRRTLAEHQNRFRFPDLCANWRQHHLPTSGDGKPGGDFQSWFYVVGDECLNKYDAK